MTSGNHFNGNISPVTDRAAERCERPKSRPLRRRRTSVDGQVYVAFSAHDLIEHESETMRSRPGHPFG